VNSSTCIDCTGFHEVCGANGQCTSGTSSASSSGSTGADAGSG
jgi:hypothetical protein